MLARRRFAVKPLEYSRPNFPSNRSRWIGKNVGRPFAFRCKHKHHSRPAGAGANDVPQSQPKGSDLAGADAAYGERMRELELALGRLPEKVCDAEMSLFLRLVFSYTVGGKGKPYRRSFAELAARPHGLCCSVSKARTTVETAERWTLVDVRPIARLERVSAAQRVFVELGWNHLRSHERPADARGSTVRGCRCSPAT